MRSSLKRLFFLIVFSVAFEGMFSVDAVAQNYEQMRIQLRQEQNKTRTEIEELKKQLEDYEIKISQTDEQFEQMNRDLIRLEREISIRLQVIQKLTDESKSIEKEIDLTQAEFRKKERELEQLIKNYKKVLTYLYKHGRVSEIALILAAENVSQMLSRSFYLKKFAEHRQKQAQEIQQKQDELVQKQKELEQTRAKNKAVLLEQTQEKVKLDARRKEQDRLVNALQKDRKKLKQLFVTKQKDLQNLNSVLDKLIAQEIRIRKEEEARIKKLEEERKRRLAEAQKITDSNKRREEVAKYEKPITSNIVSTVSEKEVDDIEKSFTGSKGKLPWPVETGVISAKFGNIVHPVYKTKVTNYGVEIATSPKANVYAIHDGIVFGVVPIPGYGDVIILNHGKYNSVYGNLSEVLVRKNSYVKAGDLVAKSGDSSSPKGNAVFLMIRQDKENLNPEQWIVKK